MSSQFIINRIILLLLILISLTRFALDAYFPTMQKIAEEFLISYNEIELTVSAYLLGMMLFQLVWGTLSDIYGRKPIIIASLIIFQIGTILCVLSYNYEILLLGRLLSGIGISSIPCLRKAIVTDIFKEKIQITKVAGMLSSFAMTFTFIAPIIGGFIFEFTNSWRSIFIINAIFSTVAIVLIISTFNETNRNPHKFEGFKNILKDYKNILFQIDFMFFSLQYCYIFACTIVFFQLAPNILYSYGFDSPKDIGLFSGFLMFSYIAGGFALKFLNLKENLKIIKSGFYVLYFSSIPLAISSASHNIALILVSIFFVFFALRWLAAATFSEAISKVAKKGSASALIGFIQFFLSTIMSASYAFLHYNSLFIYASQFLVFIILGFSYSKLIKPKLQKI